MASNEPSATADVADDDGPQSSFGQLADALEGDGGTRALAEAIENGDPDQLQHWYELIAAVPFDELQERLSEEEFVRVFGAVHLLMQWEHAQAEELKDILERETGEMAEREESLAAERDGLRAELSAMRERITARAGMDNVHEAFRAEIDALAAENTQLKQAGRERDRELAEQRERADELETRVQGADREKTVLVGNQTQLEESIRELNRRLNTQSEASQRGAEWEARKLRQRNEQALVLSEQVRELAAQNDELRAEVDRLSRALEEATELLRENARRFAEFDEQFEEAGKQLERLGTDNRELRTMLAEKDKALKERAESLELGNREFVELIKAKEAQVEKQRVQIQKMEAEQQALQFRLEAERPDAMREQELERLRTELVSATESARRLFGAAIEEEAEQGETIETEGARSDAIGAELRLRLIQMDRELEEQEQKLREEIRRTQETEREMEQKDMHIARLMAESQRYRKMAFGDAEGEMLRIEKQLEYRDKQIEQLNRRCSELQMEMEEREEEKREKSVEEREGGRVVKERKRVEKRVTIVEETEEKQRKEEVRKEEEEEEEVEEEEHRIERMEEEEEESVKEEEKKEEPSKEEEKGEEEKEKVVWDREELFRKATDMHAMHAEVIRMTRELEQNKAQTEGLKRLFAEREKHLAETKRAEAKVRKQFEELKELLLYNEEEDGRGDPLQRMMDKEGEERGGTAEDPFLELRYREHMEALELENMELRRFVENMAGDHSGEERDRRMAESTRRLVYLAVQEAKLSRRVQIGQRLRRAMAEELNSMKARLMRMVAGEESRSRQLSLQNETMLFELARLQNALLHSVPIHQHNRLLREHKKLLRDRFLSPTDGGYHSAEDEEEENIAEELYAGQQLNIGRATGGPETVNALQIRCHRLQELNDVLSGQNDSLRRETEKLKAELAELDAFMDDLEAETELKSMLANIERRFVQALRGQFESGAEREALQRELQRSERNHRETRDQWMADRQSLVHTVGQLHSVLLRLRSVHLPASSVTIPQLQTLAAHLRSMRLQEAELKRTEADIERREADVRGREARGKATETLLENDFELQAVHASLQGYQLNVLTQGAELQRTRRKLEKTEKELRERKEELDELQAALANFQYIQGIDLKQLEGQIGGGKSGKAEEMDEKRRKEEGRKEEEEDEEEEEEGAEEGPRGGRPRTTTRVLVVDNSAEWTEQLQQVREQARLCVDSYKDQLARREKTLEEYRLLVEQLRAELNVMQQQRGGATTDQGQGASDQQVIGPKSSEELLEPEVVEERWERRTRGLERTVRMLEGEKAELEEEVKRMKEVIRKKEEEAEEERKGREAERIRKSKHRTRNVQVQVNLLEEEEQRKEKDETREEEEEEEKEEEEEEESEGSNAGEGGVAGSSDSGTVEDIEQKQQNGRRRASRTSSAGTSKGSTRTLPPRAPQATTTARGVDVETMVLRHRNETRRLRMRVMELERRNKELSEQYASLRERSRLAMRTRPASAVSAGGGLESASEMLRRENERLQRQNANLTKSLETQREEAERTATRLRRMEAQGRAGAEAWEERKRMEQILAGMRKRLGEGTERERQLQERLERRERHIEQLGREQQGRLTEGARVQAAFAQWKSEKADLERREKALIAERAALGHRCRELTARLDTMGREQARLQGRLAMTQKEAEEQRRRPEEAIKITCKDAHTQTGTVVTGAIVGGIRRRTVDRIRSAPISGKVPNWQEERGTTKGGQQTRQEAVGEAAEVGQADSQTLLKLLRRAELLQQETHEQLENLKATHERLLSDYGTLLRLDRQRRARQEEEEKRGGGGRGAESAGVALLRDKLAAREREVETQRHRIIDLERKLWRMELEVDEKQRPNDP